jgi:hypothetical protein
MASQLKDLVGKVAPVLGTALGGPLGGAVVSILAEVFNVKNEPDAVEEAIRSSDPNVIAANLARAEAAFKAAAEESVTLRTQISSHVEMMRLDYDRGAFYSMWRPAAGWVAVMYAGAFCFLGLYQAYLGNYTLLTMAPQVLMIGGPIMAIAGIYTWGRSNERVAMANAAPNLGSLARDLIERVRK